MRERSGHTKSYLEKAKTLEMGRLLTTPGGFCEGVLGLELYPWQRQVLSWYTDMTGRVKGACAANNGSGKSERIISSLALWVITVFKRGTVVITSKDSRQIDHQIWPAIVRHSDKFSSYAFNKRHVKNGTGGEIVLYTTDDAGRAEGWHYEKPAAGKPWEKVMLMIFDEAKSIPAKIFESADRCTFNGQLLISSTGLDNGAFFEAMTSKSDSYLTRTVTVRETPHVPQARIDDIVRKYGGWDHPFVRSTFLSEFMSEDDATSFYFLKHRVDHVIEDPPDYKAGSTIYFLDFGGGRDENVIARRQGNEVMILKAWREANEMAAIGQFLRILKGDGARPEQVWADAAGAGKAMCSRFDEVGFSIQRFNGCERAWDDSSYHDRNSEVWDTAAKDVNDGEIILPEDPTLIAQLCSVRRGKYDSRGRMKRESKEEMFKRGLDSPDRAEAVVGAISIRKERGILAKGQEVVPSWLEYINEESEEEEFLIPGGVGGKLNV